MYKALEEKKIEGERPEDTALYQQAGRADMRPNVATTILLYENDTFSYVDLKQACRQLLRGLDVPPEEGPNMLNNKANRFYDRFRKRLERCAETGTPDYFSFSYDGTYLASTVTVIAQDEARMICKLEINNTHVTMQRRQEQMRTVGKPQNRRTILVADDEPVNCVILGEMLKQDYDILYAEDGQKALDVIVENPDRLSCVVLDMIMPKMDGLEVLRRVRANEKTRHMPVIAMTGAAELEVDILKAGVNQFFSKPLESKEIVLAKIENVIRNADR